MTSTLATSVLFIISLLSFSSAELDTLTLNQSILDGRDTLVSAAGAFELGFFSPLASTRRYVGIWYKNIVPQTVVWVANRANPLNNTSGILSLTGDGNLALHGGAAILWSTGTSGVKNPIVHLLDSGNLILSDGSDSIKWQSFDYPTNTLLAGMKLGTDPATGRDLRLTSWKSASDPSPGEYSYGAMLHAAPDIYIWKGTAPRGRSGPWDGDSLGGSAGSRSRDLVNRNFISTPNGSYFSYNMVNTSVSVVVSPVVLDYAGTLGRFEWKNGQWIKFWLSPMSLCDHYAHCGSFGLCDSQDPHICKCLPGFLPKSAMDSSDGCVRRAALGCRAVGDGFRKVEGVRLPETSSATADGSKSFEECKDACLNDCKCTGFTYFSEASGCISWFDDLVDVRQLANGTGHDFYLRLAASELASDSEGGKKGKDACIFFSD